MTRDGSEAARRAGRAVLDAGALLGASCLAVLAVSVLTGASLVVFRTGSMSPTMREGAVALVRPIAAAAVHEGDVVTVERPGKGLPVTHRVVSVAPGGTRTGLRLLTLKGDANASADPVPYPAARVGLVLASVPRAGGWLEWWGGRAGRLSTSVMAAGALGWAFWPREDALPQTPGDEPS
jgi:signal peptidase I